MKQKVAWIMVRILRCLICILKGSGGGGKAAPKEERRNTDEKD